MLLRLYVWMCVIVCVSLNETLFGFVSVFRHYAKHMDKLGELSFSEKVLEVKRSPCYTTLVQEMRRNIRSEDLKMYSFQNNSIVVKEEVKDLCNNVLTVKEVSFLQNAFYNMQRCFDSSLKACMLGTKPTHEEKATLESERAIFTGFMNVYKSVSGNYVKDTENIVKLKSKRIQPYTFAFFTRLKNIVENQYDIEFQILRNKETAAKIKTMEILPPEVKKILELNKSEVNIEELIEMNKHTKSTYTPEDYPDSKTESTKEIESKTEELTNEIEPEPKNHENKQDEIEPEPKIHENKQDEIEPEPKNHENKQDEIEPEPKIHENKQDEIEPEPKIHENKQDEIEPEPKIHENKPDEIEPEPKIHENKQDEIEPEPKIHENKPEINENQIIELENNKPNELDNSNPNLDTPKNNNPIKDNSYHLKIILFSINLIFNTILLVFIIIRK